MYPLSWRDTAELLKLRKGVLIGLFLKAFPISQIFIGLGSSLGNAERLFFSTEKALASCGIKVVKKSSPYKNPPYGAIAKNEFTNSVWQIETHKSPQELLQTLQAIEKAHGRKREKKWEDRILDLDILIFGSTIFSDNFLTIPHPDLDKRIFVLKPLAEIVASDFEIPSFGKLHVLLNHLGP